MTRNLQRMLFTHVLAALGCLTIGGCIGKELPVAPYDRGAVERGRVALGSDYRNQIYFDLETGTSVRQNPITAWDLGFECAPGGYHLILNGGKAMAAFDAGAVEFSAVTSVAGAQWRYDVSSGDLDSTAIGTWWEARGDSVISLGHVYIIDCGYDAAGKQVGYRKIRIESLDRDTLRIRIAALDGSGEQVAAVGKDPGGNFVALSLIDAAAADAEPRRDRWDLLFTRYTYLFYVPTLTPYLVTGVLLNSYETSVAVDTSKAFADITTADIGRYTFAPTRDGIGYAWKTYDLTKGLYTVDPKIIYIVKSSSGFYFKLHFVDFYNATGEKGYPAFEFQKL